MNLKEFKTYVESTIVGITFEYGISEPFSWRGSYDEVAFDVIEGIMTREEMLRRIEMAYTGTFHGYKGGEYRYNDYTDIHFESGYGSYTDGDYCGQWIARIEGNEPVSSQEERLVRLMLK
jgi:hypothetical protein